MISICSFMSWLVHLHEMCGFFWMRPVAGPSCLGSVELYGICDS